MGKGQEATIEIACIQMEPVVGAKEANLKKSLAMIEQAHRGARRHRRQRRGSRIHLVGKHPAVPCPDARILMAPEHQRRQVGAPRICHSAASLRQPRR